MLQQTDHIFTPKTKTPPGRLPDVTRGKEIRKGVDLRGGVPVIKQVFSRGNHGCDQTDENPSLLDRTDTPILVLSLVAAALSLFLFILFLSERL